MLNEVYGDIEKLNAMVAKNKLQKGKILFLEDVMLKQDIENSVKDILTQKTIIPITNVDNSMSCLLNDNTYINLYVSVSKEYQPVDIENYTNTLWNKEDKNTITFLYIEKIRPVCFLNDNGQVASNGDLIKSVVLELNKEQALYVNYIKGKAGFNITVI